MTRTSTRPNTSAGEAVADWIERNVVHTRGEWAGQPLRLAPWQRADVVEPIFGTLDRSGRRRYRTALIGVPRKAGKSTLGAAIALRLLFADSEPGAEVYSAAADRDQARIVFDMARSAVEANPAAAKRAKIYRNAIVVPKTASTYRVLSSDAFTKHGLNPHGVIFDELHAQPDRELWDVLTTGQGARRQPLTVAITTAGFDRSSICYELYDYGRKVRAGQIKDPTFFFRWWGADDDDDWRDEAVWSKAQPNLDVSVSRTFMRAEARQAAALPARQNTFRRLYLNQWTNAEARWIDLGLWDRNAGIVVESDLDGQVCFGGLDLASTSDFAAWVLVFPSEREWRVLCRFFLPQAAVERRSAIGPTLAAWQREGRLSVTDGEVTDSSVIEAQIAADRRRYEIAEIAFDPWDARDLVARLLDANAPMVEWPQTIARMNAPAKHLESLLGAERLRHGGHPILRWMADNVVTRTDGEGRIKPDKRRSTEKIDGIVALVMAIGAATRERKAKTGRPVIYNFGPEDFEDLDDERMGIDAS